jgi:hypothetical protein
MSVPARPSDHVGFPLLFLSVLLFMFHLQTRLILPFRFPWCMAVDYSCRLHVAVMLSHLDQDRGGVSFSTGNEGTLFCKIMSPRILHMILPGVVSDFVPVTRYDRVLRCACTYLVWRHERVKCFDEVPSVCC